MLPPSRRNRRPRSEVCPQSKRTALGEVRPREGAWAGAESSIVSGFRIRYFAARITVMMPPRKHLPPRGPGKASARERVRAQWHGFDLATAEKTAAPSARTVAAVMPGVLSGIRIDSRRVEVEVVRVWNQSLDPVIVAHAQPTGLRRGTLFVAVDSSVWLGELVRYRRKEILERLQYSFGKDLICRLSFRVA